MPALLLGALLLMCAHVAAAALPPPPSVRAHNVEWLSLTPFDSKTYADGMPSGNGVVVALAWGNASSGGLSFFVRSPLAKHTDTALFTIARVHVSLSPNPFTLGTYVNQTLNLEDGSITLLAGGTSAADAAATLSLFVDALSPTILVSISTSAPSSVAVTLESVRPSTPSSYTNNFYCNASTTRPDTFLTPTPPSNLIGLFHDNNVSLGDPDFFTGTLEQQQLSSLRDAFTDPFDGRVFGAGITGAAGADGLGSPLVRTSPYTLSSSAPDTTFVIRTDVRVDMPPTSPVQWQEGLVAGLAQGPPPAERASASRAWWDSFWARSFVEMPPSPPQKRVGVFPCIAGNEEQTLLVNATSGEVRLADGSCFFAGGGSITTGTCAPGGAGWALTPCTASNCKNGDLWVSATSSPTTVWDLPGAKCPWIDTYAHDVPTGVLRNQIFSFNASDKMLRTSCSSCASFCVTAVGDAPPSPGDTTPVTSQYARARFVQAIQARGTNVPIQFNGMLMLLQTGSNGINDVDYRQWGPDSWWQNTRLPYGAMLAAGDYDSLASLLDWISSFIPLLTARSQLLLPEHSTGIYSTETVTAFGLFQQGEYQCGTRPDGYPPWLENSGWVQYDFGGNAFGPEAGLMALDHFAHTGDLEAAFRYVPIATKTLDFYMHHYANRSADGKMLIWPTQVLESWWCAWPGYTNCNENDLPQVAALLALVPRILALPESSGLLTPAQRTAYTDFLSILPPLPVASDGTYAAAAVLNNGGHNSEGPWLFATHPFRIHTVGTAAANLRVNLSVSIATWHAQSWMRENSGWSYGGMNAALLGLANESYAMILDRALLAPAPGYRFPVFAPHLQDFPPSADHFANLLTATQFSLLQTGEDGFGAATIVLLPAWPCTNTVRFRLHAAQNTTVDASWDAVTQTGTLAVEPPTRAAAVTWAACVTPAAAAVLRHAAMAAA